MEKVGKISYSMSMEKMWMDKKMDVWWNIKKKKSCSCHASYKSYTKKFERSFYIKHFLVVLFNFFYFHPGIIIIIRSSSKGITQNFASTTTTIIILNN